MADLFRQILMEALESSQEKFDKSLSKLEIVQKALSNQVKFKKDFAKFFYEMEGPLGDSNAEMRGSEDDYIESCCKDVVMHLQQFICNLAHGDGDEKDIRVLSYNRNRVWISCRSYMHLPEIGLRFNSDIYVLPNKSSKKGKKFQFDLDLNKSSIVVYVDDVADSSIKYSDEDIDLLKPKSYQELEKMKDESLLALFDKYNKKYNVSGIDTLIKRITYRISPDDGFKSDVEVDKHIKDCIIGISKELKIPIDTASIKIERIKYIGIIATVYLKEEHSILMRYTFSNYKMDDEISSYLNELKIIFLIGDEYKEIPLISED